MITKVMQFWMSRTSLIRKKTVMPRIMDARMLLLRLMKVRMPVTMLMKMATRIVEKKQIATMVMMTLVGVNIMNYACFLF